MIKIFFFTFFLIFLVGCSSSSSNILDIVLQTGKSGLEMSFSNDENNQVIEGGTVYTSIEIRNEGFSDIERGILIFSPEQDLMEIESFEAPNNFRQVGGDNIISFDLRGKSLSYNQGEKQIVSLVIRGMEIDDTLEKMESSFVLTACYPYSSVVSDTVCVDTDPNGVKVAEKSCEAKDLKFSGGQGAPLEITKVEQRIIPGDSDENIRVQFMLYAKNSGPGIVLDINRFEEICTGDVVRTDDLDIVNIGNLKFSNYEINDFDCIPNPMRKTKDGYFSRCELIEPIDKDRFTFESPIVIELFYGYKESVSKNYEILNTDLGFR